MIRYTDPENGRSFYILIEREGADYRFRLLDGAPGRQRSAAFRGYMDALRAGLEAARALCRKPPH